MARDFVWGKGHSYIGNAMRSMVNIFREDIDFRIEGKRKLEPWIKKIIKKEGRVPGNLNFILCNDSYLRSINKKYLNHDYNTDVITFDNSMDFVTVTGDIFISIERVRVNAKTYNATVQNELRRVMAHGVLHLLGYRDKSPRQKKEMTKMEDWCLSLLK